MKKLVLGDRLELVGDVHLSSFIMKDGLFKAYVWKETTSKTDGVITPFRQKIEFLLPFSLPIFALGSYPYLPFMHPSELPPDHPDMLLRQAGDVYRRNRDGALFKLELSSNFPIDGEYTLHSVGTPSYSVQRTSLVRSPKELLDRVRALLDRAKFKSSQMFDGATISAIQFTFWKNGTDPDYARPVESKIRLLKEGEKRIFTPKSLRASHTTEFSKFKNTEYNVKIHYEFPDFTTGILPAEIIKFT